MRRIVVAFAVVAAGAGLGSCGAGGGSGGPPAPAARFEATRYVLRSGVATTRVHVGDLDGDGLPDLCLLDRGGSSVRLRITPRDAAGNPDVRAATAPAGVGHVLVWDTVADLGLGDLDGDGRLDLVCCDATLGGLAFYRQDPDLPGALLGPELRFVPEAPAEVHVADLDRDGRPDLLCLDAAGRRPVLYPAPFSAAQPPGTLLEAPPGLPGTLAVADLDRDGLLDVVAPLVGTGQIAVWTQQRAAPGTFALALVDTPAGPLAGSLVVGDLNGDGRPDLLVDTQTSHVRGLVGAVPPQAGTYVFELHVSVPTGAGPGVGLGLGDLDGDGRMDLVIDYRLSDSTGDPADLALCFQEADGSFAPPLSVGPAGTDPVGFGDARGRFAIADLDLDGDPDLLAVDPGANEVVLHLNERPLEAGIAFAAPVPIDLGAPPAGPEGVRLADLDGDGRLDFLLACDGVPFVEVHWGDAAAPTGFLAPQVVPVGGNPASVLVADLDLDGQAELICPVAGALGIVHRDLAVRNFSAPLLLPTGPGPGPTAVAVGDLDGDGRPDLAVATGLPDVRLYFQSPGQLPGALAFDPPVEFLAPLAARALAIGDLDGDGHPDLALADPAADGLAVYVRAPLEPRVFLPLGESPLGGGAQLALADLDRDGALDVVAADPGGLTLTINARRQKLWLPSNFRLALAGSADGSAARQPSVAVGDLDRDGRPDLVCTSADGAGVVAFLQARDAWPLGPETWRTFVFPHLLEAGSRALAVGDVDRDGRPDLVTAGRSVDDGTIRAFVWRQVGGP